MIDDGGLRTTLWRGCGVCNRDAYRLLHGCRDCYDPDDAQTAAERNGPAMTQFLLLDRSAGVATLHVRGDWRIANAEPIAAELAAVELPHDGTLRVDFGAIESMDLAGAWLLRNRLEQAAAGGAAIDRSGGWPGHFAFIDEIVARGEGAEEVETPSPFSIVALVAGLGRTVAGQLDSVATALTFLGRIVATFGRALGRPRGLRPASVVRHVYETGIQAVGIVSLIAFLIAVIVAYLGSQQLRAFGAEIFTVDLVAIGVLREMGVLLTSILVAGRSGSAFAAEIGVMQLNDEVDALKATGVDPFEVLVIPRLLGLTIALPLLTIIADAMGLAGGALLSITLLDISLEQFLVRLRDALSPSTFWAGLIKAPVFALLIAMVGTYRGMQVRDSSRELGRLTTVAVVQSIFLVILADALFAVFYVEIDF